MLGVVGERFPKGGAITMGTVGGIGMLSAGLLGGPGIGYVQDKYASEKLQQESVSIYDHYAVTDPKDESRFLLFQPIKGLDGKKVGELMEKVASKQKLTPTEEADAKPIEEARLYGGQMALRKTALVPAVMALGYLLLLIYFRFKGGLPRRSAARRAARRREVHRRRRSPRGIIVPRQSEPASLASGGSCGSDTFAACRDPWSSVQKKARLPLWEPSPRQLVSLRDQMLQRIILRS